MGFLKRFFGGIGKTEYLPRLIAEKCPKCGFWTETIRYFWLPREIGDRIGRTGSMEERRRKWIAYGKLWIDGQYAVDLGDGQSAVVPVNTGGYYDEFEVPESPKCPVCGTLYSQDWPKVSVTCKKCGRNVIFEKEGMSVICISCGHIHHIRDVVLESIA